MSGPALVNLTANNATHNGGGLCINQPFQFEPNDTLLFFFQKASLVNVNVLSKHNAGLAGSALYGGNQLESCASLRVLALTTISLCRNEQQGGAT